MASDRTSEMLALPTAKQCSHPACHHHDLLPLTCPGCQLPYCLSHHSPFPSSSTTSHPCPSPPPNRTPLPCPLCASPISTPPGLDPNTSMDRHLGSPACEEAARRSGLGADERARDERRVKRAKGELCWLTTCRKGTKGGLGVRCEACAHTFCLTHRTPTSHTCSPSPSSSSSTPPPSTRTRLDRSTPLSLSSAPTNAGLAALRRQHQQQQQQQQRPPQPSTAPKQSHPTPTPTTAAHDKDRPAPGLKPVGGNPLKAVVGHQAVASRRSKAEQASRDQALAHRASLGLLSADEQVEWARVCAENQGGRRRAAGGRTKGKATKAGCVVG